MEQHPRTSDKLHGHGDAVAALKAVFDSNEVPHAWLVHGPRGIGKATFVYHAIRYLMTHEAEDDQTESLFGEALPSEPSQVFDVDMESPIIARLLQGSHADVHVVEPTNIGEDGKEKAGFETRIYQMRELYGFLGQTSSESKWQVVIIDDAEEMNNNAANALLKLLEEPPKDTLFFLISHTPGRLLPTIHSRCRKLALQPLDDKQMDAAIRDSLHDVDPFDEGLAFAQKVAKGAPGRAITLYEQGAYELYQKLLSVMNDSPDFDIIRLQDFAQSLSGKTNRDAWQLTIDLYRWLLGELAKESVGATPPSTGLDGNVRAKLIAHYSVDEMVALWEKAGEINRDVDVWNLDPSLSIQELVVGNVS